MCLGLPNRREGSVALNQLQILSFMKGDNQMKILAIGLLSLSLMGCAVSYDPTLAPSGYYNTTPTYISPAPRLHVAPVPRPYPYIAGPVYRPYGYYNPRYRYAAPVYRPGYGVGVRPGRIYR